MDYVFLKAQAKINLALDVLGKREDGYHELSMIMQSINLYDTVFIKKTIKKGIDLETNLKFLPINEKNLVYKAADLLIKKFEIDSGVYIDLKKSIPVSAGLGGGSSDCAATLVGMKKLFNLPVSYKELMEIGLSLGSDVPFCIYRGTAKVSGKGEKIIPLKPHPKVFIVLAKPPISVSTASIFKEFNLNNVTKRPNIDKMILDLKKQNLYQISKGLCNVLETVTEKQYPIIKDLKEAMLENNALGSIMSGSGPTVFGYFKYKKDAFRAIKYINKNFKQVKEVFFTTTFNPQKRNDRNVR